MSNPSKARGTRFEVAVCSLLRAAGFSEVFRLAPGGVDDAGDVGGLPDWALECRDRARIDLAGDVADAQLRAVKKGAKYGAAIIKKRGHPTGDAYVALSLTTFTKVLEAIESARRTTPK